jgi:hypothetical protein
MQIVIFGDKLGSTTKLWLKILRTHLEMQLYTDTKLSNSHELLFTRTHLKLQFVFLNKMEKNGITMVSA